MTLTAAKLLTIVLHAGAWNRDHVQFGDGDLLFRHVKVDIVMIVHNHTERLTNYAE